MITLKEAYKIAKKQRKGYKVCSGMELSDSWIFGYIRDTYPDEIIKPMRVYKSNGNVEICDTIECYKEIEQKFVKKIIIKDI